MSSRRKTKREEVFPLKSKRPAHAKNEGIDYSQCGISWAKQDASRSYFILPCKSHHTLCPLCFSSLMASKGAMHYYRCPCCKGGEDGKEKHTHWDVCAPQVTPRLGGSRQKSETHSLVPPNPTLNPVLHHHANYIMNEDRGGGTSTPNKAFTLSLTRTKKNKEGKTTLHAISFTIPTENIDTTISNENKKKLATFFQLLQPVLVLSSKKLFQNQHDQSSASESGNILFDAATSDNTCLFQCLYSLSTGRVPPSIPEIIKSKSTQQKKVFVQIFGIVELVRSQCIWKGRSVLKNFVSQQLMVNCASHALYRVLNQIGVSNSNETVRVDAINDSKKKILAGYPLEGKKYDLFLILFDNLGFRIRGGKTLKVGYEQYTALELVNIPKESLIKWGVYPNRKENKAGKYFNLNYDFFI